LGGDQGGDRPAGDRPGPKLAPIHPTAGHANKHITGLTGMGIGTQPLNGLVSLPRRQSESGLEQLCGKILNQLMQLHISRSLEGLAGLRVTALVRRLKTRLIGEGEFWIGVLTRLG
jgi:hypothetical protein